MLAQSAPLRQAVDLLIMRKLSKINSFSNVKCQQKLATLIKANYTIESTKGKKEKNTKEKQIQDYKTTVRGDNLE